MDGLMAAKVVRGSLLSHVGVMRSRRECKLLPLYWIGAVSSLLADACTIGAQCELHQLSQDNFFEVGVIAPNTKKIRLRWENHVSSARDGVIFIALSLIKLGLVLGVNLCASRDVQDNHGISRRVV